jgi:Zinc finger, ZZ type
LTGEIYFRRVNLWNHPPSGWFLDRTKHADFLVQTLKRYALQTHLDADALPDAAALGGYKVTLFHIDSDNDKILISSGQDLCDVLLQVRSEAVGQLQMGMGGSPSRPAKPVAKIIAKVEEVEVVLGDEEEESTTLKSGAEEAPSASNRSTAATQTSGNTEEEPRTTEDDKEKKKEEAPASAPAPGTAPRACSSSNARAPPPTVQDVVDAVVGIVGPAVRISVRAIEHAVVAHNNSNAERAIRAHNHKNNSNTTGPEINVAASSEAAPTEEAAAAPEAAPGPPPFIHGRHTCDGCLTTPIVGERYHCLDLPDFDFCKACYEKYDGPHKFEPVELGTSMCAVIRSALLPQPTFDLSLTRALEHFFLYFVERDVNFQERWHRRRRARMHSGRPCGGRRGFRGGPHHGGFPFHHPHPHFHHHHHPHGGPHHPWGPPPSTNASANAPANPPAVEEVDSALKEAIRRSLQDLKDKKVVTSSVAAESKVDAAAGNLKAPPAVATAATTTTLEPPSSTSTSRYAVSVDSDDEEDNVEDDVKMQAAKIEAALFEDAKQPPKVETKSVVESVPAPSPPQPSAPVADDDDDDVPAPDTAHVNVSVAASEFSEDALGNGDVAAALGNMMDVVASCIQEMNGQFEHTAEGDDEKSLQSNDDDADDHEDAKLGAKIVDGEEHRPDDLSVDSGSSHGSWVVDDEFAASPEAMARAAMEIGSSLLSSDMAQSSTGHPHPETATSTLSSSSSGSGTTASSGASAESFSSVGSVPTTVPSIAAAAATAPAPSAPTTTTTVVGHITEDQLQRWSVQLRHLHELGFHEDAVLVDIIERLHAANVGVDSTDEVTVQQVVHELIKTWK